MAMPEWLWRSDVGLGRTDALRRRMADWGGGPSALIWTVDEELIGWCGALQRLKDSAKRTGTVGSGAWRLDGEEKCGDWRTRQEEMGPSDLEHGDQTMERSVEIGGRSPIQTCFIFRFHSAVNT